MMFIFVLDSRPEIERYLDIMYSRLCGSRLFRKFSEVFYIGSSKEELLKYISRVFSISKLHKLDKLDLSDISDEFMERDLLVFTSPEDLGSILGRYKQFLDVNTPAVLILSFEDGSPKFTGVLTVDLFRFIEI